MDNAKHTKAIGSVNFNNWCKEVVKHFQAPFDYNFDSTITDDLIKISYKDEFDISGNPKAILICKYGSGSNLWSIDFDDSFIDLGPSDILSFRDYK
jgi:hypothetical protein